MAKTEGIKRKLKPVIEKKRRDRINYNLEALRDLLYKNTADTRLQSHKLEKAEILDLAVQYIRKTTRKMNTKGTSNEMDSKATMNQSVSVGATTYVLDFNGRFNPSEQKAAFPKLGDNLENNLSGASTVEIEPAAQTGISKAKIYLSPSGKNYHQELLVHPGLSLGNCKLLYQTTCPPNSTSSHYNSPPSSPIFTSASSSLSNSPTYISTSCPLSLPLSLPPCPDTLSSLKTTTVSLHRSVSLIQPFLPHIAKEFTPPQSPVLRQDPFPLQVQSTWRPWS
ncbi:hairy-related 11 [Xyrauchen texanus]|uniref:hairy-related 11 n=1 Tax=Xyrauchen texanus TaxID=154827 RepID=UPI002241F4A8|nr:hairy-related 11 [Xyrauchen texanus]